METLKEFITKMSFDSLVPALLSFVVCLIAMKLLVKLCDRLLKSSKKMDAALQGFVLSAIKIILWLLTAIIVAEALGIPTTSLVALFSVAGLALSLSVQNIMSNLFSGITLLMSRPFAAGDFVDVGGKSGTIKSIGLFYTVIRTVDNMTIDIPNSDVTASAIVNYSREPLRRVDMVFSASYDDATESVKNAIMEAVGEDSRILSEPEPFIGIKEYKASSVDYTVRLWCENADYWNVFYAMNENVRESFKRNGISMTYEHLNVHILEK